MRPESADDLAPEGSLDSAPERDFDSAPESDLLDSVQELQRRQADQLATLLGREPAMVLSVLEYWLGPAHAKGCDRVDD